MPAPPPPLPHHAPRTMRLRGTQTRSFNGARPSRVRQRRCRCRCASAAPARRTRTESTDEHRPEECAPATRAAEGCAASRPTTGPPFSLIGARTHAGKLVYRASTFPSPPHPLLLPPPVEVAAARTAVAIQCAPFLLVVYSHLYVVYVLNVGNYNEYI